jgi:hypothetical protein
MQYQAIAFVEGKATIRLSSDGGVVQIEHEDPRRIVLVDPFDPQRVILPTDTAPGGFTEVCTTTPTSPERFIVGRLDIETRKDKLSRAERRLLDEGVPYSINLDLFGEEPAAPETETLILRVLRRTQKGYSALCLTSLVKEQILGNDENLVAMLDLLGFTEIMRSHTIEEVEKKLSDGVDFALASMQLMSKAALVFSADNDVLNINSEEFDTVRHGVFADTVIIFPADKRHAPLESICDATILVIDWALTLAEWLFRGGIEIDSFRADLKRSRFLG